MREKQEHSQLENLVAAGKRETRKGRKSYFCMMFKKYIMFNSVGFKTAAWKKSGKDVEKVWGILEFLINYAYASIKYIDKEKEKIYLLLTHSFRGHPTPGQKTVLWTHS